MDIFTLQMIEAARAIGTLVIAMVLLSAAGALFMGLLEATKQPVKVINYRGRIKKS